MDDLLNPVAGLGFSKAVGDAGEAAAATAAAPPPRRRHRRGARQPDRPNDINNLRASGFEKRLAEPRGEETCPDYFMYLRPPSRFALNTAQGARTPLATAAACAGPLGALGCLYAAAVCAFGNRGDVGFAKLVDVGTLGALILTFVAAALCGISLVAGQLRLALRPGGGELALLGAGSSATITASALRALERWRRLMRGVEALCAIGGVVLFYHGIIAGFDNVHMLWLAPLGPAVGLGFPPLFEFLLSLEVAQTLATEQTMEVVRAATELTPDDTAGRWAEHVEAAALALKDGAIGQLSLGWGKGLAMCYGIFWGGLGPAFFLFTLGQAAKAASDTAETSDKVRTAEPALCTLALLVVPLWLSTGVARTSTACDDVMRQLNLVRIDDSAHHTEVLHLETSLRNLNDGQGLGFLVGLTVLDKAKLKSLMFGVAGLFSTVLPLALVLYSRGMVSHEAIFAPAPSTGVLQFDGTNAYMLPPSRLLLDEHDNALAFGGWVKVEDTSSRVYQRVFDFANGPWNDGIFLTFVMTIGTIQYGFNRLDHSGYNRVITTSDTFPLDRWVHVAVIHAGGVATIYWDGAVKARGKLSQPPSVVRRRNYIGQSNWAHDQSIAAGAQMHDLTWYNTPDITIEQIRTRNGPKPLLSAGLQIAPVPIRATGPSGWLELNGTHSAADSSQSLSVSQAFDGDATTTFTTCCGNTHWVEYALLSPRIVERYYLLASDAGCPSGWQFQAQQCEYTQAFPYVPYLPSCEWVTLDERRGEQCNNHTAVDPATFDIAKDRLRGAARYRWLFSGVGTLTELGMGSNATAEGEQETNVSSGHRRRRVQKAKPSTHGPPTSCGEAMTEVAGLKTLVWEQQAMIVELQQSIKAQHESIATMKEELLVAIARGSRN